MSEVYRPYPPPCGPWLLAQTWSDLLFVHWPVPAEALRPLLPAGLPLDTFDGAAWLGVVPFRMSGVRPRLLPALPWLSTFPELNVRTYVVRDGRPGVFFFSLDAGNPAAVALGRGAFRLPYFRARMLSTRGQTIAYVSERRHRGAPPARFVGEYAPVGPAAPPPRGSLAHFLTARYCLYAADRAGRLYRAEIDHAPWPLQPATATIAANTMSSAHGIAPPEQPPLLHFARRLAVRVWPLRRLA
ncbi:MAG TPA: DUF2071 domain-containing protein [Dehalococcoidia bacterium]|nr:DUF2071 domain-containing protein [Dehalococcoidia bacterium]